MRYSVGDKIVYQVVKVLLLLFAVLCLFPFINVIATSFSAGTAITSGQVTFWPVGFTTDYYRKVFHDQSMLKSLLFTIELVVLFVTLTMTSTVFAAYPLSKKRLKGRKFLTVMITFTMYFGGGIIPSYLLVQKLGLLDSIWALVLPGLINTYYFIIMKTFFTNIPDSLLEAATIDGSNDFGVLFRIVLPLSFPVLATLSLFYAVERWNSYQDAVFYITDTTKYTLQLKLRAMILLNQINQVNDKTVGNYKEALNTEGLKAASLIFATIPILIVYPRLQKYFVQGMTIGAVKG